jgi:hypothetical protein
MERINKFTKEKERLIIFDNHIVQMMDYHRYHVEHFQIIISGGNGFIGFKYKKKH